MLFPASPSLCSSENVEEPLFFCMNVLISGSTGLIGRALVERLAGDGHRVIRLVRQRAAGTEGDAFWDPAEGEIDLSRTGRVDAVVHLAGENIAGGRWTRARKRRIRESRERGTRLLAETIAAMDQKPQVFVSASAIGWYGERGDEVLTEESTPGEGFLAEVGRDWEDATKAAAAAGIRVVNLRLGMVLTPEGGALRKMLLPFRLGLGGPLAGGRQWMSWITLEDAVGAVLHALNEPSLAGPVNAVAPNPVRNREFTRLLAKSVRRPAPWPVPRLAVKALFGEMGEATALASARVEPRALMRSGFAFSQPRLDGALKALLEK